jgi:hydrogenase nickel incorporation protein HypB
MCTVCGCSEGETKIEGKDHVHDQGHSHDHSHDHAHDHGHDHHHGHSHGPDGSLEFGAGAAGVHVAGQSQARLIEIEQDILSKNDSIAAENRTRLEAEGIVAINMMSSPGSGKTTLLVETMKALKDKVPMAVIEGDQQTSNDAARIRETGVPALQVNTGKGCHLDADMVRSALNHMELPRGGVLFIENVGNLVCPAGFDLGEARRVALASVTEGEDKPLKYPEMFASSDAVIVSKCDLLPHLAFDVDALIANARKVRPRLDVLKTSTTGAPGLEHWLQWLDGLHGQFRQAAE